MRGKRLDPHAARKSCATCKVSKPLGQYHVRRASGDGKSSSCKDCVKEQVLARYWSNPEKGRKAVKDAYTRNRQSILAAAAEKYRKMRQKVIAHYGGRCACCGEEQYEFLAMDHPNGDGARHRREIGKGSQTLIRWLLRSGLPPGYRVLCHNCNAARGYYGRCPHERTLPAT